MAFINLYREVVGSVPKIDLEFAKTLVNRAYAYVRRQNFWSFQLYDGPQWITPILISTGLVNVTQGSATVTVNAAAAAAITAGATSFSAITQRQFRVSGGTIYNIWGWDGATTITLDRVYGEATQTGVGYNIFQIYYTAPYADHVCFISIRNMAMYMDLILTATRADIDERDPMRYWIGSPSPSHVVYYQVDQNPSSATYRYHQYEMWGIPLSAYNYQLYGIRNGTDLSADSDTVPVVIGEDCIIARANYYAYVWAEAHKDQMAKGGPDFKFLMGQADTEFKLLYRDYRRRDRETVNNWLSHRRLQPYATLLAYYNTQIGRAYAGMGSWLSG